MSILFYCENDTDNQTFHALNKQLPDHDIHLWPECGDPTTVDTAVVWQPPNSFFNGLSNLKHVLSIAAGVDHLLNHPGLPSNVSIVRLTDAGMADPMADYVLYGVLHAQRQMTALRIEQTNAHWNHRLKPLRKTDIHVGILGAGQLGSHTAKRLVANGYRVSCWSRTQKEIATTTNYSGETGLTTMLSLCNVLVCLLPLTASTKGILSDSVFESLPTGAFIINAARGDHLDENALLNALETEQLSGALLDVFQTEPLPDTHPFWSHERIVVTPHVAAPTPAQEAVEQIAESIRLLNRGETPAGLVDRHSGY